MVTIEIESPNTPNATIKVGAMSEENLTALRSYIDYLTGEPGDASEDLSDLDEVDYSDNPVMMKIIEDGINAPDSECEDVPEEVFRA